MVLPTLGTVFSHQLDFLFKTKQSSTDMSTSQPDVDSPSLGLQYPLILDYLKLIVKANHHRWLYIAFMLQVDHPWFSSI